MSEQVPDRRYALISPCRNEAQFARRTIESVASQTIPPTLWIIVDDGSTDETAEILAEYEQKLPYLKVIRRADRGFRKLGGGVIDAFYDGYEAMQSEGEPLPYFAKFDLDLEMPPTYFEHLVSRMEATPRIGTASGKPFYKTADGTLVSEKCGPENSVGMVKFYRAECFSQIGGFVRELMWDGIDGHRARMLGWIAASWDDPELRFLHLRPMGTSHRNWWTGRVRHGVGQHFMGTAPTYMLASAIYRMTRPPRIVGGLGMLWGYLKSAITRRPRYDDPAFVAFLRRFQWECLRYGKTAALERINQRQEAVWRSLEHPELASDRVD
jgi:biofilm PGA synthesis N-glycosyltransferase PgaC